MVAPVLGKQARTEERLRMVKNGILSNKGAYSNLPVCRSLLSFIALRICAVKTRLAYEYKHRGVGKNKSRLLCYKGYAL